MNQHLQTILNLIQQAEHLTDEEKAALLKAAKNADKELEITSFKLDRTEKVKRTTAILLEETIQELEQKRKAVEAQNRELEIEAALERVRTVAMGMSKPEDLLNISKIQFNELKQLGFTEMRNALIGIFHDDKNYFSDYDFSDFSGGSITKIPYNKNRVIDRSLKQMKSATDAFTEFIVEGNELEEWKAFRKQNGEYDDTRITSVLYYYFYSIEQGNVGISTFKKISDEQLNILKKFRNIFDLAYKRYVDITNAEAQAREAQIQLALERARTQSMIMQHSTELDDTLRVFHEQVLHLNIPSAFSFLWLPDEDKDRHIFWAAWAENNSFKSKAIDYPLDRNEPATALCLVDWKSNEPVVAYHVPPASVNNYFAAWNELIAGVEELKPENFSDGLYYVEAFMKYGCFGVMVRHTLPEDEKKILHRFAVEFERAYTRFLDLQKAEAHSREAQIELALERVRARTMAMQHSDELADASFILDSQIRALGIKTRGCAFNIYGENDSTEWFSSEMGTMPTYKTPRENVFLRYYEEGQKGKPMYINSFSGEACAAHYDYLCTLPVMGEALKKLKESGGSFPTQQIDHAVYFKYGYLLFITLEPVPESQEVFIRFAKVFEQTYTRFLDLQKAEAQAREAQIEASLEKVRSRSLAVHKSEEFNEVVKVVFENLKALGLEASSISINTFINDSKDTEVYICGNPNGSQYIIQYRLPYFDNIISNDRVNAQTQQTDFFSKTYNKEEKDSFYKNLLAVSDLKYAPDEIKNIIISSTLYTMSYAVTNHSMIVVNDFAGNVLSQHHADILKRFSKVFEQTYTRFLDLQKAEAQSKEAQIQLALERVRARTMAMQKSDELSEAVYILFQQFKELGENPDQATIGVINEEEWVIEYWVTMHGNPINKVFKFSVDEPNVTNKIYKAWKENKKSLVIDLSGDTLIEFMAYRAGKGGAGVKPDEKRRIINVAFFTKGLLNVQWNEARSEESIKLLERFASVFEQTYTRFLDLQKAEAHAKEAQIELGLERVRARAMAMHGSDELKELVKTLFEELIRLDVNLSACLISTFDISTLDQRSWMFHPVTKEPYVMRVPYNEQPFYHEMLRAWKERNAAWSYCLEGKTKIKWEDFLFADTEFTLLPQSVIDEMRRADKIFFTASYYSYGAIQAASALPFPAQSVALIQRFSKVFDLSYTRFLDLQKAETQAREAQIELGLERVRARAMAMQISEELKALIGTVFIELKKLDLVLTRCVIWIFNPETNDAIWWMANSEDPENPINCEVPYNAYEPYLFFLEQWKMKTIKFQYELKGKIKKDWDKYLFSKTGLSRLPGFVIAGMKAPECVLLTASFNNFGALNAASLEPLSDEHSDILLRFAKVFDLTYTRFNDLKQAEAAARESQIEAALERVRSRTLAMQKSDELAETSAVLFKQLINLGIEPHRLYISIMKGDEGETEFWITDEDGSKISSAYTDNLNTNASFKKMYEGWKAGRQSTIIDMQGKELQEYFQHLTGLGVLFKDGLQQKRRIQHLAYFNRGFIGMAAPDDQPEETIHLLQRFAAVFNLTFTRFNDLKIAEAHALQAEQDLVEIKSARQKAEDALTELQATQQQLIQSEKMASLGELTAGIAHEIQNPLNFVNNFSEVSNEMIDEMKEELATGNLQLATEIAEDIKQNLEKINHHGKRADAIVKGMLQHSKTSTGKKEPTDINKLADEYLRLSYHGLRAKDKNFNADMKTDFDETIGKINIVSQDIGRVLLNLYNNAFYAVSEKSKNPEGFKNPRGLNAYKPLVSVQTKKINNNIEIKVTDNGNGIPQNIIDKIFQPFFTTKPTGQGTGLGLSLSYDIIKAHGGEIKVESKEGEGTKFIVFLSPNILLHE